MIKNINILEYDYLQAKDIVRIYEDKISKSKLKSEDLKINQKVKTVFFIDRIYYVTEIDGNDILLRTLEDYNHELCDNLWVSIYNITPYKDE